MKLTKNHKIIIGVVGLGILAYATKKYWMPKKKTTSTTPTGNVSTQSAPNNNSSNEVVLKLETKTSNDAGGNATREDEKDQKYRLLSDFQSLDTKSMKMINLKKGDVFINKKGKGNYIYMNKQASMDVYDFPNEKIIVGIPYNILGKIN
jgi:hypothetical protein